MFEKQLKSPLRSPLMRAILAGGGTAVASLPQIGSLVARWSSDAITPQADNTSLSSWADSIGGVVASQVTGAAQPKYRTARLGVKPSVQFPGSQWLSIATPGALKTAIDSHVYTMMIVFNNAGASSVGNLVGAQTAGGNNPIWFCDGSRTGRYDGTITRLAAAHTGAAFTVAGTTAWTAGKYGDSNPVERSYINGTCVGVQISATPVASFDFGFGAGPTGVLPVIADIYEIMVWNTALTAAEVLQVQKAMCDKYAQAYPWSGISKFRVFDGDSLSAGYGGESFCNVSQYYGNKMASSLGLSFGQYTTTAIPSYTLNQMASKATTDIDPIQSVTGKSVRLMAFEWYNSRAASPATGAQTYVQARKSAGISQVMWGTSTDDFSHDAERTTYNNAVVAGAIGWGADALVQIHLDSSIGVIGACPGTGPFTPYFDTDGLHMLDAGYAALNNVWQTADALMP